ncbi:hypothetical protein D3C84_1303740 [compost metagenome]
MLDGVNREGNLAPCLVGGRGSGCKVGDFVNVFILLKVLGALVLQGSQLFLCLYFFMFLRFK